MKGLFAVDHIFAVFSILVVIALAGYAIRGIAFFLLTGVTRCCDGVSNPPRSARRAFLLLLRDVE